MQVRRLVKVAASCEFLAGLFSGMTPGDWVRWDGGVPADARCVNVLFDYVWNRLWFVFEHESFKLVPEGCEIPDAPGPMFTRLHGESVCASAAAGGMPPDELRRVLRVPDLGAEQELTGPGTMGELREVIAGRGRAYHPPEPCVGVNEWRVGNGGSGDEPHVVGG